MKPITKAQRKAIYELYRRNPDGSPTYRHFRKRFTPILLGGGSLQIDSWCGLFVGIEKDGYTHT
jgi:hypothetical protein